MTDQEIEDLKKRLVKSHEQRDNGAPRAGGVILDRPTATAFERLAKRVAALETRVDTLQAPPTAIHEETPEHPSHCRCYDCEPTHSARYVRCPEVVFENRCLLALGHEEDHSFDSKVPEPVGTPEHEETPEHAKHCAYRHSGAACTCELSSPGTEAAMPIPARVKRIIDPALDRVRTGQHNENDDAIDWLMHEIRSLRSEKALFRAELIDTQADRTRLVEALANSRRNTGNWYRVFMKTSSKCSELQGQIAQLEQHLAQSRTEIENAAYKRAAESAHRENEQRALAQRLQFRVDELTQQIADAELARNETLDRWKRIAND